MHDGNTLDTFAGSSTGTSAWAAHGVTHSGPEVAPAAHPFGIQIQGTKTQVNQI